MSGSGRSATFTAERERLYRRKPQYDSELSFTALTGGQQNAPKWLPEPLSERSNQQLCNR